MSIMGHDPAFPELRQQSRGVISHEPGMTYRQWLAGMAVQGLLANARISDIEIDGKFEATTVLACSAVLVADAVIKQLAQTE